MYKRFTSGRSGRVTQKTHAPRDCLICLRHEEKAARKREKRIEFFHFLGESPIRKIHVQPCDVFVNDRHQAFAIGGKERFANAHGETGRLGISPFHAKTGRKKLRS